MKKRLLKVAITAALTMAFAVPVFANPFTDVPASHWAYQAVNQLVKAGVVDGYSDGTFKGDKTVTRYEMAQMVSKAMGKSLNADQKAVVGQLSKEFATELDAMGVKVDGVQKQVDNMVKLSGDARVRVFNAENGADNNVDYRVRVTMDGKINKNMSFNARLSSGDVNYESGSAGITLDTANVTFKALGLNNTIGRQSVKLADGYLFDTKVNGLTTSVGNLKLVAGNKDTNRIYAAEYDTTVLGAKVKADYFKNDTANQEIYGLGTSFKLVNSVTANAQYFTNNDADATAIAYGVKFNKLGLSATYRDVEKDAYTGALSTLGADPGAADLANGFKGMEYQYDKNIDKNATLNLKYQDFEKQDGTKIDARTLATVNVKF